MIDPSAAGNGSATGISNGLGWALVGGLVTNTFTATAAWLRGSRAMRWEIKRYEQEKLEEIAMLVDDLASAYAELGTEVTMLVVAKEPTSARPPHTNFSKLQILVQFHARELIDNVDALWGACHELSEASSTADKAWHRVVELKQTHGDDSDDYVEAEQALRNACSKMIKRTPAVIMACDNLSEKAAKLARARVNADSASGHSILQRITRKTRTPLGVLRNR